MILLLGRAEGAGLGTALGTVLLELRMGTDVERAREEVRGLLQDLDTALPPDAAYGRSHAAPRTPLESPWTLRTRRVSTASANTHAPHRRGTLS